MTTAVLKNGTCYAIPPSDMDFFMALAQKLGWVKLNETDIEVPSQSWIDQFAGKWEDSRSTEEIINDIHQARTPNSEINI